MKDVKPNCHWSKVRKNAFSSYVGQKIIKKAEITLLLCKPNVS